MHDYEPVPNLGLGCPKGGDFWICANKPGRFIGCCTSNPCETDDGVCPDDDLEPATFGKDAYAEIPGQACVSDNYLVQWYICAGTTPPFIGCCTVDPCEKGSCPDASLKAARLSDLEENADKFMECVTASSAPTTSSASMTLSTLLTSTLTTSTTTSTSTTSTGTVSSTPRPDGNRGHRLNKGGTAAISISMVIVVVVLLVLVVWQYRARLSTWKNNRSTKWKMRRRSSDDERQDTGMPEKQKSPDTRVPDPLASDGPPSKDDPPARELAKSLTESEREEHRFGVTTPVPPAEDDPPVEEMPECRKSTSRVTNPDPEPDSPGDAPESLTDKPGSHSLDVPTLGGSYGQKGHDYGPLDVPAPLAFKPVPDSSFRPWRPWRSAVPNRESLPSTSAAADPSLVNRQPLRPSSEGPSRGPSPGVITRGPLPTVPPQHLPASAQGRSAYMSLGDRGAEGRPGSIGYMEQH
ncbi:hypothetical protein EDB80DRAFT_720116 [Ilyonectria destructans]|nr:hypothetical protein EDB80DRAFT_720116 [Ilyonectria destructans]